MAKWIWAILLLLLSVIRLHGQVFHIRCLSIGSNGEVTVTWDRNGLTAANFQSFQVLHSNSATGPFVAIDSVFIFSDTVITHTTAAANTDPAWYIVQYRPNNGSSVLVSDTVRALQLSVLNPGSGFANLAWSQPQIPASTTSGDYYQIYREWPRGFFTLIDSVALATAPNPALYSDLISICNDTINYRIELIDEGGCRTVSNVDGDLFRDLQPPAQPSLDSVSVSANGDIIVGWPVNPSTDTRAYVILQGVGTIWTPIDTNIGRTNTVTTTNISGASQPVAFQLVAVDSCGNPSAQSTAHTTMYLQGVFLLCEQAVALSWNPYTSWATPASYDILRSASGGPYVQIGVASTPQFYDSVLVAGTTYCYRIRARDATGDRTSTSSTFCVTPDFPPPPNLCVIRSVSVTGPSTVQVVAAVDASAIVSSYELLRAIDPAGPFISVARFNGSGFPQITFDDDVPSTDERVYYYQVVTIDSCGSNVLGSQVSRTILLKGFSRPDAINSLQWSDYGQWPTGVSRYNLYLSVNGILNPVPVAVITAGQPLVALDTVISEYYSDGTFCYVAEAIESLGNPDLFLDSSRSNVVCLSQEPGVYVPNAFRPGGGINEVFRPYPVFLSSDEYSLVIFNRWGREIFSTENINAGWDGSMNGTQCGEGVYVYRIQARKPDGTLFIKTGSVTLIR